MSEELEETEKPSPSRGETILARAKAATMIIGAIATACTAVWGAVRQPPEPGAKLAYDVLKEALQYERDRREKIEEELDELKSQVERCSEVEQRIKEELRRVNMVNVTKSTRSPASVGSQIIPEITYESTKSNNQTNPKNRTASPKLPSSQDLGL